MITVKFKKKNENYFYFESVGHADYDEHGKDIVCAAVSVLAQTLVNALYEIAMIDPIVDIDEENGFLRCELKTDQSRWDDIQIQTIFKTTKIGIEGILEVYDDFVELLEEEV